MDAASLKLLVVETRWAKAHRVTLPVMSPWYKSPTREAWSARITCSCVDCALYVRVPLVVFGAELTDHPDAIEFLLRGRIQEIIPAHLDWVGRIPCDPTAVLKWHRHQHKERRRREYEANHTARTRQQLPRNPR